MAGNEAPRSPEEVEADRRRYLDSLREQAAMLSDVADEVEAMVREMPDLLAGAERAREAYGVDPTPVDKMAELMALNAQETRLIGQIQAAQARAYEELLEAGGPENEEAYARYTEITERHTELLPKEDMVHEYGDEYRPPYS